MPKTKVSVIVPSYRRPVDLRRCLDGLKVQSRPADEILVIARGDDAETLEVVSAYCNGLSTLRTVLVKEPGVIAALNRGLDCATGDFIALTDDDAEPFQDWLERIEAGFSSESTTGAIGGRDWIQDLKNPAVFDPVTVDRVGSLTWYGHQYGNHHCRLRGNTQKVHFLKGVNLAVRSSALDSYRIDGSLRGSGAQWGWETDLCMQIRNEGSDIVFDDRILVKHFVGARPRSDNRADTAVVLPNIRFNNQYLIAKHFNLFFSLIHLCNGLFLGSHYTPGLAACVKWTFRGDMGVWQRLFHQTPHAFAGFGAGRRARAASLRVSKGLARHKCASDE